ISQWDKPTSDTRHTGCNTPLHPLVQRNTSTLWEQQFSSTFHGEEFFLADHVVKGQRIMPGVVYLEMARAAVREAIGTNASSQASYLHFSNVVWVRPLIVSELPVTVHITLEPEDNTTIAFLISHEGGQVQTGKDKLQPLGSALTEEETAAQIYCQGRAVLGA